MSAPAIQPLKPCPWCGGAPKILTITEEPDHFERETVIRCDECGISIVEEYRSGAIAAWNRRAPAAPSSPAAAEMLEALKEVDRLSLVISSAVRIFDPSYADDLTAVLLANRAAIAKAQALPGGSSGVVVKPLEWKHEVMALADTWFSETIVGTYFVRSKDGVSTVLISDLDEAGALYRVATPELGKAAAQADYERRIRSALSAPEAVDPRLLANGCSQKLKPDEPFFVLLGRDKHAAVAVRAWLASREAERGVSDKTEDARQIANAMDAYSGHSTATAPEAVEAGLTPEEAWRDLVEKDDRNSPEEYPDFALISFNELSGYMRRGLAAPEAVEAGGAGTSQWQPTHRHKKTGGDYMLVGVGRMQTKWWVDWLGQPSPDDGTTVDMREVTIYQGADGKLWVRPVEEFNDGRFEGPQPVRGDHGSDGCGAGEGGMNDFYRVIGDTDDGVRILAPAVPSKHWTEDEAREAVRDALTRRPSHEAQRQVHAGMRR